jgi:hypothetical protein
VEEKIKYFLLHACLPLALTLVAAASLLSPAIAPTNAQNETSPLYPVDSAPFGVPYKDWVIRWWEWDIAIPTPEHPNTNYTQEKCGIGQDPNSPVWFLALPFGEEQLAERTCSIPKDKAIISGLLSGECDYSDSRLTTDDQVKQCASEGDDYGTIQVLLDGVDLKYDMKQNRVMSDFFNITLPENNFFSAPVGTFRAVAEGFYLFLKPLTPGEHELKYKVSVLNPTKTEYNYFQEVTYHLNIT